MEYIIDLHIHSTNSDGTFTTQELLDMLHDKHANLISFTDHDSVGCYKDIINGKATSYEDMIIIPRVELSCSVDGNLRDMLGYGFDIFKMHNALEKRYSIENRIKKQEKILEKFKKICREKGLIFNENIRVIDGRKAEGFVVMYNELNKYPQNIEKYPFIANNTNFYWDYFSKKGSDFYVDETYDLFSFKEAVSLIHSLGGKAFLAHPFAYGMDDKDVERLVREAVDTGIDGIELRHSSNKKDDVKKIKEFANKYNLLYSGGTDFHGKTKPGLELVTGYGNVNVQIENIEDWIFEVFLERNKYNNSK